MLGREQRDDKPHVVDDHHETLDRQDVMENRLVEQHKYIMEKSADANGLRSRHNYSHS